MKCAVYPYSDVLYPLLEHRQELTDGISIEAAVYPRAWRKLLLHEKVLEQITSGFDFEALTADVESDPQLCKPDSFVTCGSDSVLLSGTIENNRQVQLWIQKL